MRLPTWRLDIQTGDQIGDTLKFETLFITTLSCGINCLRLVFTILNEKNPLQYKANFMIKWKKHFENPVSPNQVEIAATTTL